MDREPSWSRQRGNLAFLGCGLCEALHKSLSFLPNPTETRRRPRPDRLGLNMIENLQYYLGAKPEPQQKVRCRRRDVMAGGAIDLRDIAAPEVFDPQNDAPLPHRPFVIVSDELQQHRRPALATGPPSRQGAHAN